MSRALRRAVVVLVAVLVAQAAWIMATPPFRGTDEIDHVYRAAGVASGQWHLSDGAQNGRGQLVWVPADIAAAAKSQCDALTYVGPDNCHRVVARGGDVRVATAAGAYDPLFYWVVGTAARPFHGASADYAMRAATALICALMIALGVFVLTWAGAGRWATLGILAALSPEVFYSSILPAPDGPEMAIGFVLWASLLAACRVGDPKLERRFLALAVVAAAPLTFMRMLGPLWVLVIIAGAIAFAGWGRARELVARQAGVVLVGVVAVGLAAVWWGVWILIAGRVNVPPNAVPESPESHKWILAFNLPAWLLQMVGAFPFRDQPAPLWVYPLAFFAICLLVGAAWRRAATAYSRRVVFWSAIAILVIPVALSVAVMPSQGAVWQGRYELPVALGFLPLCGLLLDDAGFAPVEAPRLIGLSAIFLAVTQVACVVNVERLELARAVSRHDSSWVHPPEWGVGVLMLAAAGIACCLATRFARPGET
jgi:hypothetical protein